MSLSVPNYTEPSNSKVLILRSVLFVFVIIFVISGFASLYLITVKNKSEIRESKITINAFKNEEEFLSYLGKAQALSSGLGGMFSGRAVMLDQTSAPTLESLKNPQIDGGTPKRVSETNVQVLGIDEPDIVKTDGKNIFYSQEMFYPLYAPELMIERKSEIGIMPPYPEARAETKLIQAFPPTTMMNLAKIEKSGQLLVFDNTLVILANDGVYGYDVVNPSQPTKLWLNEFDQASLVTARAYKNKLYVILSSAINFSHPCEIPLFKGGLVNNSCGRIYYPSVVMPVNTTYTVMEIDPITGKVAQQKSFVGASGSSVVYMSGERIYLGLIHQQDYAQMYFGFLSEDGLGLVPKQVGDRIEKLKDYDLSAQAKLTEIEYLLETHKQTLTNDERVKFDNDFLNQQQKYAARHIRELENTTIIKLDTRNFENVAVGSVPGRLLNQFSVDEYNNNLRLATTVGGSFGGSGETENDLYVLDSNLNTIGSIIGLGIDEQIYSARFIGNRGYLVTFKQIDPFFVVDLSNPRKPEVSGQLKIPGYSSYLHPLADNLILGVGEEDQTVKLSLFDVSNPNEPKEVGRYVLSEYWTEILSTHRAFLHDSKHSVFFVPGSAGGYVMSYENNNLVLRKAVSQINAKRAVYIDDYLYIVGDNEIRVIDEKSWVESATLDL